MTDLPEGLALDVRAPRGEGGADGVNICSTAAIFSILLSLPSSQRYIYDTDKVVNIQKVQD